MNVLKKLSNVGNVILKEDDGSSSTLCGWVYGCPVNTCNECPFTEKEPRGLVTYDEAVKWWESASVKERE